MDQKELARRLKRLRNRKGYSQEELAEKAGLSLRTVQRIENGETDPRGDSLGRLAAAFDVPVEELADWCVQEDKGLLIGLNLSAFSFILSPLLGILVPLIIWISKKDKVMKLNEVARKLLNFELTWTIVLFAGCAIWWAVSAAAMKNTTDVSPTLVSGMIKRLLLWGALLYGYHAVILVINLIRIGNGQDVRYRPAIPFLRKR